VNFFRMFLRGLLQGAALAVLLLVSGWNGVKVHHTWRSGGSDLVTYEFVGMWPRLKTTNVDGPSYRAIIDDEVQAGLDRLRGVPRESPSERVQLVVEDGQITFEKLNDQGEVIRTTPVSTVSAVDEEEPTLFVDTRDRPPPPDPQALADEADAVAAAESFWWQRKRLVRWRKVQEMLDAKSAKLQEREPDEMVHLLAKTLEVPEDAVWKNYDQAVWLARLIALRDDPRPDPPMSWYSWTKGDEWEDLMYPFRIKWIQAGLVALGLSIFTGALGYLSIMLTAGPRSRPATSH
jgi:hypothetical protein